MGRRWICTVSLAHAWQSFGQRDVPAQLAPWHMPGMVSDGGTHLHSWHLLRALKQQPLNLLALGASFMEGDFSTDQGRGNGFWTTQAHFLCTLFPRPFSPWGLGTDACVGLGTSSPRASTWPADPRLLQISGTALPQAPPTSSGKSKRTKRTWQLIQPKMRRRTSRLHAPGPGAALPHSRGPATHVHRASWGCTCTCLGCPLPWQRRVHAQLCLTVFLWPPAP